MGAMPSDETKPLVAIAGNPNTGKTTVFNLLTGSSGKVGNYPGVTVERQIGALRLVNGRTVRLMDVPGTYSLSSRSAEEQLAISALAGIGPFETPELVILVVDSTQLTRNLYLALQVIELGLPMVIALNMSDRVSAAGTEINAEALATALGVPVVPMAATKHEGFDELRRVVSESLDRPELAKTTWRWDIGAGELAEDVRSVGQAVPPDWYPGDEKRRDALALWSLLSIDDEDELEHITPALREAVRESHTRAKTSGRELDHEVISGRYGWIDEHAPDFVIERGTETKSFTDRIDRVLLHPAGGFLVFLLAMALVFQSLFTGADPAIGFIEGVFGQLGDAVEAFLPAGIFSEFIVSGIINGVGSVLVFLPQILLLFFFIGLMEDTGYMARVATLMDRVMKSIGLHGRAFVPMLSGYACAVPAILGTRTMERKRDRYLTMMVVPLMTCSARLPVYGLMIAALYPPDAAAPFAQGLLMVAMYLFSTVIALVVAAVLGRTILKGPNVPLILEMPPYRMPHWPSVMRMMWQRGKIFITEAGTVILLCTIGIWVLLSFPRYSAAAETVSQATEVVGAESEEPVANGSSIRDSYAGQLGRWFEPAVEPLGFDWKISIGLIGAFAAREVFVSTMAVVYDLSDEEDETSSALRDRIRAQRRPDGSKVYTPLTCLSLMVFFALACQCMSTLAVVKRETNSWAWTGFLFAYQGALAWIASFLVYQGGKLIGFD